MRKSLALLSLALLSAVALPGVAKADSFSTFNFNGALSNGSLNGTITIDTTIGSITGENFSAVVNSGILKGTYLFNKNPTFQGDETVFAGTFYNADFPAGALINFQLTFPVKSLIGYTGGNICSFANPCSLLDSSNLDIIDPVTSGSLTVAATPEPSSLLLLGTGVLGLAGAVRRRYSSAA